MKTDKSPWKLSFACVPLFSWRPQRHSFSGRDCFCNSMISSNSSAPVPPSQAGFLLVFLLPLLLLLGAFFLGSLKAALHAQARVALQSRLDICAVELSEGRQTVLARLTKTNAALRLNVKAIYVARAAKNAGPYGMAAGSAAEAVLLPINRALALLEDGLLFAAQAKELASLRCRPDLYSSSSAFCAATPPIASAVSRENTLYT
jgi:hypothetical protein